MLAVAGLLALAIAWVPFDIAKAELDRLAADGSAPVSPELFDRVSFNLRLAGVTLLLLAGTLYLGRLSVYRYVNEMGAAATISVATLKRWITTIGREDRTQLYALGILMCFAVAIRVHFLFGPIRYDEAYSLRFYASKPMFLAVSNYSAPNNHVLHTLLMRIAYLLFGGEVWAIRLPALIAGLLLVPATYLVARTLYNKHAALLAAGWVAASSALIEFSVNGRGYTLVALIFILTVGIAAHIHTNSNRSAWLSFAMLSALGFFTIPIMLYAFSAVCTWLLVSIVSANHRPERALLLRRLFAAVLTTIVTTLLLYLPVFVASGVQSVTNNQFVTTQPWRYVAAELPASIRSSWALWHRDLPPMLAYVMMSGAIAAIVLHRRMTTYHIPIVVPTAVAITALIVAQRVVPFPRVWLFLLPLYIIVSSAGVAYLLGAIVTDGRRHWRGSLLPTAGVLVMTSWLCVDVMRTRSVYYSAETGTLRDAEPIARRLARDLKPGDKVLSISPSDAPLEYYFNRLHVSPQYWNVGEGPVGRLFVVVNETEHQTLKQVLEGAVAAGVDPGVDLIVMQYDTATIHQIDIANTTARVQVP